MGIRDWLEAECCAIASNSPLAISNSKSRFCESPIPALQRYCESQIPNNQSQPVSAAAGSVA
ncbi:hypothetical protein XAP7430_1200081 [Xanthomonas phaseoli pv. phaseoli]|uniref:Uncharacterized protein n=1 Tax=Xanthomonas campestris pv. phaseoli TaxID=317013 RepID=A0AB38DWS3_XANCH|nr:hypothetical protein XAP6984_1230081 [Xanthomonas phaseoli pv. phaseoli]SON81900.1 hypothetical protein XAP7430_1200081 [Xanthomonas phaseoli pv. phaseoli]